jgi:hypothetical protein
MVTDPGLDGPSAPRQVGLSRWTRPDDVTFKLFRLSCGNQECCSELADRPGGHDRHEGSVSGGRAANDAHQSLAVGIMLAIDGTLAAPGRAVPPVRRADLRDLGTVDF